MLLWAAAGPAQAAPAQPPAPRWRVVYRTYSATAGPLTSVTAPARDDAWAVGTQGGTRPLILHWNGAAWTRVTIPGAGEFEPRVVTSTSPDDVWILGHAVNRHGVGHATAYRYDGRAWHPITLPAPFQDGVFAAVSASDAWGYLYASCVTVGVGSGPGSTECASSVWHWNGATWSLHDMNGLVSDITAAGGRAWFLDLTAIQGVTANHTTGLPVVYAATGAATRKVSALGTRVTGSAQLAASAAGQLWVLAHVASARQPLTLYHWTAPRWVAAAVPARAAGAPLVVKGELAFDGGSGVWAGPFAHWTGRRWVNADPGRELTGASGYALAGIAPVQGTAGLWAVGWVTRTPADKTHDTLIARYA